VLFRSILGTLQYAAPEYFIGQTGTRQSDYFSLGVIAYQMLTGKLPYGTQVPKVRTRAQLWKLRYVSAQNTKLHIPDWIDGVLKKLLHPDPFKRYDSLSEITADLRTPNKDYILNSQVPLAQKNPVLFWKVISVILTLIIVFLAAKLSS